MRELIAGELLQPGDIYTTDRATGRLIRCERGTLGVFAEGVIRRWHEAGMQVHPADAGMWVNGQLPTPLPLGHPIRWADE